MKNIKIYIFLVICVFLFISGCSKKVYVFERVYSEEVSDPNDLTGLMQKTISMEQGIISLGFNQVSLKDDANERLVEFKGDYKHFKNLTISISFLKSMTSKRSQLRLHILSSEYKTEKYFPEGDEIYEKIIAFTKKD